MSAAGYLPELPALESLREAAKVCHGCDLWRNATQTPAQRYDTVMDGAWVTTQEIIAGFLLAIVVSIPLALAVAYSRFVENAIYPVVVFLQIVPKIAIAPLFIIWFGFGFTPKLLLVFLLSFFPIVVSSIAGFKAVEFFENDLLSFGGTRGWLIASAGRRSRTRRLHIPGPRARRRDEPDDT